MAHRVTIVESGEASVYLCGSPNMIRDAMRACIDRGAGVDYLYAEGFNFQSRS